MRRSGTRTLVFNLQIDVVTSGPAQCKADQLTTGVQKMRDIDNQILLGLMSDHEAAQLQAAALADLLSFYCTHHKLKGAVDGATAVLSNHSKPLIDNSSEDPLLDALQTIHTNIDPRNPNGNGLLIRAKLLDRPEVTRKLTLESNG
eukprot:TRINITY_DN2454_c0_g3_i1.p1 TRINITY_DN2454_c0_g3~~TRINITY_DN2454_c0_g3_i1.p1  ORF type:complete len:146 (-),score=9.93 TRINITY_DN2454_c0_g3_i1:2-439(-)